MVRLTTVKALVFLETVMLFFGLNPSIDDLRGFGGLRCRGNSIVHGSRSHLGLFAPGFITDEIIQFIGHFDEL